MIANNNSQDARDGSGRRRRSTNPRIFQPQSVDESTMEAAPRNPDYFFIKMILAKNPKGPALDLNALIQSGVTLTSVRRFKSELKLQKSELLDYLDMSEATFSRRKKAAEKKLTGEESGRVYRYAHLYALATNLFHGDKDEALRWLKTPAYAFKGETPLEHARTEYGIKEVETLIGRMAHGIPS